jgi:hypothetical protein
MCSCLHFLPLPSFYILHTYYTLLNQLLVFHFCKAEDCFTVKIKILSRNCSIDGCTLKVSLYMYKRCEGTWCLIITQLCIRQLVVCFFRLNHLGLLANRKESQLPQVRNSEN